MARYWARKQAELSSRAAFANLQQIFFILRERKWCGSRSDLKDLRFIAEFGACKNSRAPAQLTGNYTRAQQSVKSIPV
jgi:hypothetical protein